MKNIYIPLQENLHSDQGTQKAISFELRTQYYTINGKCYPMPLKPYINNRVMEGYDYYIQNTYILLTLFFKEDIIV